MKEFLDRPSQLSTTVIIAFVWLIIAFVSLSFAGISYGIFAGIVAVFFAVLSLRE